MAKTDKQNKSKMSESAELTQALMRCPGLGIYIVQDGKFQYANSLFQELTGYTEEELRNIYPLDLVHPEDRELVREKAIENLKGRRVAPYEYRFIKKNGEIMWNLERLASIRYMGKRAAVGSFMDITEHRQMEEALADEVTRRRILMERSRDGISVLDENSKLIEANQRFAEMLGYTSEELKGLHTWDWDTQWTREELLEMGRNVDEAGAQLETRHRRKDGTFIDVDLSVNGAVVAGKKLIFCVARDITERKQAEEEIRLSEQNFRDSIENSPLGIRILAKHGETIYANRAMLDIWGYSSLEEMEAVPREQRYTPESYAEHVERIEKAKRGEPVPNSYETSIVRSDGQVRILSAYRGELIWNGEKQSQIVHQDITERKQAEEALRRSEQNFHDSIENSPLGMRVLAKNGKHLYANRALLDMWGYSSVEEMEAVPREQRYIPESYARHIEILAKRKRGEPAPLIYELSIVRSDGQVRHLSLSRGELLWNGEQQFQIVYQDITARKQAEQNFRDSIENSPLGMHVIDKDGKHLYTNRALLNLWGYSTAEELEAVPRGQRYTPESYAGHIERIAKRKRGEPAPLSYEISIVRSDGQIRHLSVSRGEVMWNGEQQFQVVYQDITERIKAEEALRLSEQNFRDSIESSPLGIRILDKDGKTLYANRALLNLWGYSSVEEMEAVPRKQRYTPQTYAEHLERLEKKKRGEPTPLSYDTGIVRSDGEVRILSVSRGELLWNGEQQFQLVSQDITEYKQMEEALTKSEERYRTVLEQMEEAYYETDLAGKFTFCNDAMCRQLGYPREELMGMSFKVLTPPEDVKSIFGLYNQVYSTGEPFTSVPIGRIKKDGTRISVESSIFPLRNESGEITGFRGIAGDVTERRLAEEALAKSEERYRTVLEQMEEAYFETDIAGNFTFCNDAMCRQLGYPREELMGGNYRVYTPEDDVQRVHKAFSRVYETGKPIKGVPMGRIRKDGTRISAETSAFPLWDESGKIIGFRGIIRDVTERARMVEALSQSEERYRTILAEIQEGYYEVDLAGSFTFVNDALCRQLGYSREELIGMNYEAYVPKEEIKGMHKAWNKVYRTGKPLQSHPFTGIRKDKKQVFLEASVSPSRNNEGKIIGFRSIARDVTERAQYERKLAEMATHDALTGLPNRTLLSDRFTVALALSRRTRNRLAVLMLDLDRFKAVNDSMGHDVGDKLLKAVGKRLEVTMRKSDTVARIGGDEFVLVLPQIPHADEAAKFAQRILDAFREPFVFGDHRVNITTSIGVAIYPEGGKDIESLLKSADTAMYWAKEQGRDIYRFWDGSEAATLLAKRRTA